MADTNDTSELILSTLLLFYKANQDLTSSLIDEETLNEKLECFKERYNTLFHHIDPNCFPALSESVWEKIFEQIRAEVSVKYEYGSTLSDGSMEPWVNACWQSLPERKYWEAYKNKLFYKGWLRTTVGDIDRVTDDILDQCGDPQNNFEPWQRRGLVIGDVQSGKTAVYTGLINKAADAGYKVIIVLTGVLETLRQQTQSRLDDEFIGRSSREDIAVRGGAVEAASFTSVHSDFKRSFGKSNNFSFSSISGPVLFVVKKNVSVLKAVHDWLKKYNYDGTWVDYPLLLIDDEADNASINTRKDEEDPTKVNNEIRRLLRLFKNSTYVGFTATPFANVFIDSEEDEDLFPKNFIRVTNIPTNYFGVQTMLGDNQLSDDSIEYERSPYLCEIDDGEQCFPLKHKKGFAVIQINESLRKAINQFLLCNAIRDLRGHQNTHRSMMVNVSRFKEVQNDVMDLVEDYLDEAIKNVKVHGASPLALRNKTIAALKNTFDEDYSDCGQHWGDVLGCLYDAIKNIRVYAVNTTRRAKSRPLDYVGEKEVGLRAIVVGGMAIARGVTLEGLCVSYLYRSTVYYDTLMQMGRWFGYRNGYGDLCRIWLSETTADYYRQIARATEELKASVYQMKEAGLTPEDFGLRVRQSPDALLVTSRNKMRHSKSVSLKTSYSSYFTETTHLYEDANQDNWSVAIKLVQEIIRLGIEEESIGGKKLYRRVPKELVAEFIDTFKVHPHCYQLADYDDKENGVANFVLNTDVNKLQFWDVAIDGIKPKESSVSVDLGCKNPVYCISRSARISGAGLKNEIIYERNRIGGSDIEGITLSDEQVQSISNNSSHSGRSVKRLAFRRIRERPLLIVYPTMLYQSKPKADRKEHFQPENRIADTPFISYGLSFCEFSGSGSLCSTVNYAVNQTWIKKYLEIDDYDYDDEDEE